MTLTVTGVETIEITDPNGVCEKARDHLQHDILRGRPQVPTPTGPYPFPIPGTPPINPIPLPRIDEWRRRQEVTYEHRYDPDAKEKWQVGLTGDPPAGLFTPTTGDPTQSEKWGRNMRSAHGNGDTKDSQNK